MNLRHHISRAASALALAGAVGGALGGAASLAIAQPASPPTSVSAPSTATPAAAASMSFQQVIDRVAALGYRDVREIERKSDKLYEIKARDDKGQRVELYVDARSGEVLRQGVKRFGDD